eukprot:COSAG02_NODE_6580_length_3481_cov_249.557658_2_plen_196_part_00
MSYNAACNGTVPTSPCLKSFFAILVLVALCLKSILVLSNPFPTPFPFVPPPSTPCTILFDPTRRYSFLSPSFPALCAPLWLWCSTLLPPDTTLRGTIHVVLARNSFPNPFHLLYYSFQNPFTADPTRLIPFLSPSVCLSICVRHLSDLRGTCGKGVGKGLERTRMDFKHNATRTSIAKKLLRQGLVGTVPLHAAL